MDDPFDWPDSFNFADEVSVRTAGIIVTADDSSDDDPFGFDDSSDDDVPGFDDPSDDGGPVDDLSDDGPSLDDRSDDGVSFDDPSDDGPFGDDRSDDDRSLGREDVLVVVYLYEAALDRNGEIDLAGLNFWVDVREGGLSERALAAEFLRSEEFAASFGPPETLSDRELVETCYRNILDRDGDEDGVQFWTGVLAGDDFERPDIILAFAVSPENLAAADYDQRLVEMSEGVWDLG